MTSPNWQEFFTNPGLYVLLVVFMAVLGSSVYLFRQVIAAERRRADDYKALYKTEHETSMELLEQLRNVLAPVAETANKVFKAIPQPGDEG